jgi:hypothetical protein
MVVTNHSLIDSLTNLKRTVRVITDPPNLSEHGQTVYVVDLNTRSELSS